MKDSLLNRASLAAYVDKKLITERKHPTADLYIYNYTPIAQFSRTWDDVTLACRGLILDGNDNIVARPFRKFFNLEEHVGGGLDANKSIAKLDLSVPYTVTDKMDGSLGIAYPLNGSWALATRGSFESKQALVGTGMLQVMLENSPQYHFEDGFTYLFEIIFPENRIVVDYGNAHKLVLIAKINNETGIDAPIEDLPFEQPEHFLATTYEQLKEQGRANREGFVLHFADNTRVKVKHADYIRLHRILTNVSSVNIWEYLRDGKSLEDIIKDVPDEFYDFVARTTTKLRANFEGVQVRCEQYIANMPELTERKDVAQYFAQSDNPSGVLWAMYDHKDYAPMIWRLIRPEYSKPFAQDIDA